MPRQEVVTGKVHVQLELILLTVAGLWVAVVASVVSLCMAAQRGDARAREMTAAVRRGTLGSPASARISRLPAGVGRR